MFTTNPGCNTARALSPDEFVKRGDIILYRLDSGVAAHRVIAIQRRGPDGALVFTARGDASTVNDEPVASEQILGKVVFVEGRFSKRH